MNRCLNLLLVAVAVSAASHSAKAHGPAEERREAQRGQAARQDVAEAEKEQAAARQALQAAARSLAEAEKQQDAAADALRAVRERVEERLREKLGLNDAVGKHQEAERKFREAAEPVLDGLKSTAEYQAALREAEKARSLLKKLRGEAAGSSASATQEKLSLLSTTQRPAELEKRALDANPPVAAARQAMLDLQTEVAALRAEIHAGVDGDSQVRAARDKVDSLTDVVDLKKAHLARKRQGLASAQAKLARARQGVDKAIQSNRKDDQQDRRQDKKPNGKKKK